MASRVERVLGLYQQINDVQFNIKSKPNDRKIARYIINDMDHVIFMTSSEIANKADVSQPAVIRFAQKLGYSSFSEFMKDLQELSQVFSKQQESNLDNEAQSIIQRELESINNLQRYYSEEKTLSVANRLYNTKQVHVFGARSSEVLAHYFYFYFRKLHSNVILHTQPNMELFEKIITMNKEEVIFLIFVYPRYSKQVLDLLNLIKKEGIPYIVFADSYALEKAQVCDVHLVSPVTYTDVSDSHSATFSLLNILLHKIAAIDPENLKRRKERNEQLYRETGFFSTE